MEKKKKKSIYTQVDMHSNHHGKHSLYYRDVLLSSLVFNRVEISGRV